MSRLPSVTGKEAIRAFERLGYERKRQRGSHVIMDCEGCAPISVPEHGTVKRGLLLQLLKVAGFSQDEFRDAL